MNNDDIDAALRELAASPLPASPDFRAGVRRSIAAQRRADDWGEMLTLLWLKAHPLAAAASLVLAVLVGVAPNAAWPDAAATSQSQLQAARALHLDGFTATPGLRAVAIISQPVKER